MEWTNQTWLRADAVLLKNELHGIVDIYPYANKLMDFTSSDKVTAKEAVTLVASIAQQESIALKDSGQKLWNNCGLTDWNESRDITRGEMAILIDKVLDPFHNKPIDITGRLN